MDEHSAEFRTRVRHFYAVTDQLQTQLRVLEERHASLDVRVVPQEVPSPGPDEDVETIAFAVLVRASRSAQDDLRALMDQVKAVTKARRAVRAEPPSLPPQALDFESVFQLTMALYVKTVEAELDDMLDQIEKVNELSEMESLRLQMAMDRLSKMMSALSNAMKKLSETSSAILQNLR